VNNPRKDTDVLAPAEVPDPGELARMQEDREVHRPMAVLFWICEDWWRLTRELNKANNDTTQAYDDGYEAGIEAVDEMIKTGPV